MGEAELVLNTLLLNRIYHLKGPLLFADSYSVFKRRLWQLKTTKIHNIFSFSSYWQNREPKVCSTNNWHSLFLTYNKIENTLWISVTCYICSWTLDVVIEPITTYIKSFDVALFTDSMNYHKHVWHVTVYAHQHVVPWAISIDFLKEYVFGKWQLSHARRNKSNFNQFIQAVVTKISYAFW